MKRILFLFLILISAVSFGQQTGWFDVRPTAGGNSVRRQLLDTDVPSNFLRSGTNNTITGTTVLNGGGSAIIRLGQPGNEIASLRVRANTLFEVLGLGAATFSINSSGDWTAGMSSNSSISIGGSTGTNGYVLTTDGTYVSWQPASGAPLDSPEFTGTPTAPTAALNTNTTQIATMEAIQSATLGSELGQLFSFSSFPSTTGFTANGSATVTTSANNLRVGGGSTTASDMTRYVTYDSYVTSLDKWSVYGTYKVDVYSSTSFGPKIGLRSTANNSASNFSFAAHLDISNSGTGGKIYMYYQLNNTASALVKSATTGTLPLALNDVIKFRITREGNKMLVEYENVTQEKKISDSFEFSLIKGTSSFLPNKGKFTIFATGTGTYDFVDLYAYSTARKGGVVLVGDSQSRYYANSEADTWFNRVAANSGLQFNNLAQASHVTSDAVDCLSEIIALQPKYVLISLGTNDAEHTSLATFQTQMDLLTDGLTTANIPYYINEIIGRGDAVTTSTFVDWLHTTYPESVIIPQRYAFTDGTAQGVNTALMADVAHKNWEGHKLYADNVVNFLNLGKRPTSQRTQPLPGMIQMNYAANGVNYMTFANAATGVSPTFTPTGSDTNIGETHAMKGTGSFRVDGNFLINNSAAAVTGFFSQYTTDAIASIVGYRKARGTLSSPSTVANGDGVGFVTSKAYTTTNLFNNTQAAWGFIVNGTVSSTLAPTDIVFMTHATGGDVGSLGGSDTRLRVSSNGNVGVGLGSSSGNSTLHVNGSVAMAYVAKTGAYTLTGSDYTVEVTSGTHTQTLPTAVGIAGRTYVITNSGSGTVTIGTTSSQTFVNVTATPTTLTLNQFQSVTVQSNGANWLRLSTL